VPRLQTVTDGNATASLKDTVAAPQARARCVSPRAAALGGSLPAGRWEEGTGPLRSSVFEQKDF